MPVRFRQALGVVRNVAVVRKRAGLAVVAVQPRPPYGNPHHAGAVLDDLADIRSFAHTVLYARHVSHRLEPLPLRVVSIDLAAQGGNPYCARVVHDDVHKEVAADAIMIVGLGVVLVGRKRLVVGVEYVESAPKRRDPQLAVRKLDHRIDKIATQIGCTLGAGDIVGHGPSDRVEPVQPSVMGSHPDLSVAAFHDDVDVAAMQAHRIVTPARVSLDNDPLGGIELMQTVDRADPQEAMSVLDYRAYGAIDEHCGVGWVAAVTGEALLTLIVPVQPVSGPDPYGSIAILDDRLEHHDVVVADAFGLLGIVLVLSEPVGRLVIGAEPACRADPKDTLAVLVEDVHEVSGDRVLAGGVTVKS